MPCQESVADAKITFVSAVSEGIDVLMNRCGYSRDRATSSLLRELNRGETYKPSDEEIFQFVKNHGLGIDEAKKALVVSRSLKRAMTTSDNQARAIELLASKISLSNLLYESDEDQTSDEDNILRSERRGPRVSSVDTCATNTSRSNKASVGRKRGLSKVSRAKTRTAAAKTTTTSSSLSLSASRKRSIEEMLPASKKRPSSFQSRPRSDSAAEEIDAKLAKQSSEDRESSSDLLIPSPSAVRAKRGHRTDETDPLTQPLKRTRGAES